MSAFITLSLGNQITRLLYKPPFSYYWCRFYRYRGYVRMIWSRADELVKIMCLMKKTVTNTQMKW